MNDARHGRLDHAVAIGPGLREGDGAVDVEALPEVVGVPRRAVGGRRPGRAASAGTADPRLAGLLDLAVAVEAIPVTPENALAWVRLDDLARRLGREGASRGVAGVTGPVVAGPIGVAIGPGSAGVGHAQVGAGMS